MHDPDLSVVKSLILLFIRAKTAQICNIAAR
jgi:hypothetical protein